jgi:hypothetical protein
MTFTFLFGPGANREEATPTSLAIPNSNIELPAIKLKIQSKRKGSIIEERIG